jgi:hypothetical protein
MPPAMTVATAEAITAGAATMPAIQVLQAMAKAGGDGGGDSGGDGGGGGGSD